MAGIAERPSDTRDDVAVAPATLTQLFFDAVERHDRPDALRVKRDGRYQSISHRLLAVRVRHAALGLEALGVARGCRVGILSENRPEWAIADYACLASGVIDVPLYPTLPPPRMEYILRDSGAVAIFVSDEAQAGKIASIRANLPELKWIIAFDDAPTAGVDLTLAALEAKGAATENPDRVAQFRAAALRTAPDDLATIIYTSGTTGDPKGVMLSHGNIASNVAAVMSIIPFHPGDVSLSFLPLSHILERMFDFLMFCTGVSIAYVESMDTIVENIGEVRPTIVVSVPRIYEKIHAAVLEKAMSGGTFARGIFLWARGVGERWADVHLGGGTPGALLAVQYALAQRLVFAKLKARVGGRIRYFVSGGAPLAVEINKFFYAAGLQILEGYGLTESSPVIAVNSPKHFRLGTVGQPIAGVEVQIAPDGEILARGPNIMKGYFNRPDDTSAAIDPDGWLHTGDIGTLQDGFLSITDRKKDLLITAGGKNIAPQPIENQIKQSKFVAEAVLIGDRRRYPVVLVVPDFQQLEAWAAAEHIVYSTRHELLEQPAVRTKMEKEVLAGLSGLAKFETPQKVGLLDRPFSIDSGELTPTLKVRRQVVNARYESLIASLYAS